MANPPRRRIVKKSITVTVRAPVKRGTLGNKPIIPIIPSRVRNPEDGELTGDGARTIIERYKAKVKNPLTAIRAKCVECSGGYLKEVANCTIPKCALYPFRMGINPFNKRTRERLIGEGGDSTGETSDENEAGDED